MFLNASARSLRTCLWLANASSAPFITSRHASLNSAIDTGIRKSREVDNSSPSRKPWKGPIYDHGRLGQKTSKAAKKVKTAKETATFSEEKFIKTGDFGGLPEEHHTNEEDEARRGRRRKLDALHRAARIAKRKAPKHVRSEKVPEKIKKSVTVPSSIPYTTSASEFIYGTNAVEAALRCSRRKLYKLYIYQDAEEELSPAKIGLRKLALLNNLPVKMAFAQWDRLLDQMSAGRPHNGCVLEVSPLPHLPVQSFGYVPSPDEDTFPVELAPQSREEAEVNGTNNRLEIYHPQSGQRRRYPVVLLLDGIVDPGNMGAIIRSAYYLGIDAIVFAGRNSAPITPVTIKASAGAAENMRILKVTKEVQFIQQCKANGWRFYAADAPGPNSMLLDTLPNADTGNTFNPSTQSPSVIMMGSESDGLSRHIKSHADSIVSIPGARISNGFGIESDPARVDSLNVSVAAALLMEMFLRVPLSVSELLQRK